MENAQYTRIFWIPLSTFVVGRISKMLSKNHVNLKLSNVIKAYLNTGYDTTITTVQGLHRNAESILEISFHKITIMIHFFKYFTESQQLVLK